MRSFPALSFKPFAHVIVDVVCHNICTQAHDDRILSWNSMSWIHWWRSTQCKRSIVTSPSQDSSPPWQSSSAYLAHQGLFYFLFPKAAAAKPYKEVQCVLFLYTSDFDCPLLPKQFELLVRAFLLMVKGPTCISSFFEIVHRDQFELMSLVGDVVKLLLLTKTDIHVCVNAKSKRSWSVVWSVNT